MNNQAFCKSSRTVKRRKLDAVLRSFTENSLSRGQMRLLCRAIGPYRQYRFLVEHDPRRFCQRVSRWKLRGLNVSPVFGSARRPRAASAVLVRRTPGETPNTVCIYLPKQRKEERHVS